MVQGRVQEKDTVFLNGRLYRIRGQVQRQLANQFAPKTVIGEFGEESDPVLSNITWRDFSGGQGRHILHPSQQTEEAFTEFWTGYINNETPGHTIPPYGSEVFGTMQNSAGATSTNATITTKAVYWQQPSVGSTSAAPYFTISDGSSHLLNWMQTVAFRDW